MRGDGAAPDSRIALTACGATEVLPSNAAFPADLFTACLTTPIKVALRWFLQRHSQRSAVDPIVATMLESVPGKHNDRRTPLGELNWIFTAVTDSIAWNVLPRKLFQKLFRQDLLLASMFRNFLLAQRVMESIGCHPQSLPRLPFMGRHALWQSWDLAAERCLVRLPGMLKPNPMPFIRSSFFTEQLTAFRVWLQSARWTHPTALSRRSPEQLPIVLQVLLSQAHRLWALELLARFLDLGEWAVRLALVVGNFPCVLIPFFLMLISFCVVSIHVRACLTSPPPSSSSPRHTRARRYVLKLLQSPAAELRPLLVLIWAKILHFDPSSKNDLLNERGHLYFMQCFEDSATDAVAAEKAAALETEGESLAGSDAALARGYPSQLDSLGLTPGQNRMLAVYVLAMVLDGCSKAQKVCLRDGLLNVLLTTLKGEREAVVRLWICICIGKQCEGKVAARIEAHRLNAPSILSTLLLDPSPPVRAAAAFAIGQLIGAGFDAAEADANAADARAAKGAHGHRSRGERSPRASSASSAGSAKNGLGPLSSQSSSSAAVQPTYGHQQRDLALSLRLMKCMTDCSILVRREALQAFGFLIAHPKHRERFESSVREHRSGAEAAAAMSKLGGGGDGTGGSSGGGASSAFSSPKPGGGSRRMPPQSPAVSAINLSSRYWHLWQMLLEVKRRDPAAAVSAVASALIRIVHMGIVAGECYFLLLNCSLLSLLVAHTHLGLTHHSHIIFSSSSSTSAADGAPKLAPPSPGGSQAKAVGAPFGSSPFGLPGIRDGSSSDFSLPPSLPSSGSLPRGFGLPSARSLHSLPQLGSSGSSGSLGALSRSPSLQQLNGVDIKKLNKTKGAAQVLEVQGISSTLFVWLSRRMGRSILQSEDAESHDPVSKTGAAIRWRIDQNGAISASAAKLRDVTRCKFSACGILDNRSKFTLQLLFHPFDMRLLVGIDDHERICAWDVKEGMLNCEWLNTNCAGTRITAVDWINPRHNSLLLTGSTDGMARVWRNPVPGFAASDDSGGERFVCAAWAAVPNLVDGGPGLVLEWQQHNGMLLAGGNSAQLRVWDLAAEQCVNRLPIGTAPFITSIASLVNSEHGGHGENLSICGCGDGSLRLFDPRAASSHVRKRSRAAAGSDVGWDLF